MLCAVPARPAADVAASPFIMGIDEAAGNESVYGQRLLRRIYVEAFRRMGVPLEIRSFPAPRVTAMLEQGMIDGEMVRALPYAAAHPGLVRVNESVIEVVFALYASDRHAHLVRLEDLANDNARVEYRRGVAVCENTLKSVVPPARLSEISTTAQGLQKLLAKRTDYFCDLDIAVLNFLYVPEIKDRNRIRKVFDLSKPTPLFPYLHARRVDLAPRLATVLKQMKSEGLLDRYRLETVRELDRENPPMY